MSSAKSSSSASSTTLSADRLLSIHYALSWECKEQLDQGLSLGTGLDSIGDKCRGEIEDAIEGKTMGSHGSRGSRDGGKEGTVGVGGVVAVAFFLAVLAGIMVVVLRKGLSTGRKGDGGAGGGGRKAERASPNMGSSKKKKKG